MFTLFLAEREEPKIRCQCCNRLLSDFEATRKHQETGEYLDICNYCFDDISSEIDIPVIERQDLMLQDYDTLEYDHPEGIDSLKEL